MDGFSKRKKAFETKFSHDEELAFRTTAKRNRMFGLWAAELMGMNEDQASAYAQEIIMYSFEFPDDSDIINKVNEDLEEAGHDITERKILKELQGFQVQAHEMVYKDIKK